jgi:hypothetical protein
MRMLGVRSPIPVGSREIVEVREKNKKKKAGT